jgi:hypothetical protein
MGSFLSSMLQGSQWLTHLASSAVSTTVKFEVDANGRLQVRSTPHCATYRGASPSRCDPAAQNLPRGVSD